MPDTQRPEKRATLRLGQRELSGLSLLVILLVLIPLLWGLYRVYRNFKSQRDVVIAQDNLLKLYKAFRGYSADWDGSLPKPDHWTDSVAGYLSASPGAPGGALGALEGPGDDGTTVRYVYNDLAAAYNLEKPAPRRAAEPGQIVLLFERPGAPPKAHTAIPPQIPGVQANESAFYRQLSFPHYSDDGDNAVTVALFLDGS